MRITHCVVAQGHYITIHLASRELTIRTETGEAEELRALADDMSREAHAKLARARIYAEAAAQMAEEDAA